MRGKGKKIIKNSILILGLSNQRDGGVISMGKNRERTNLGVEIKNFVCEKNTLNLIFQIP